MATTYLVDGHNALFRLLGEPPENADAARRLLVERAKESVRRHGSPSRAHLVFDTRDAGKARAGTHGRDGAVGWSYAHGSADEEIVRIVRENDAKDEGNRIAVVSDDRELRGRVHQLGAAVLHVHEWFAAKDAEREREAGRAGPPLSAADFGFSSETIDLDDTDPEDV